ncbi:NFT1-like protein [Mya arenaria]|uniref:NFT1-like protein n=1 Tax=Mya arenaria TaxID=6604 RepID=A0ABY7FW17_MYAAR|nr:NFT1-like protein [Mya arenaria]
MQLSKFLLTTKMASSMMNVNKRCVIGVCQMICTSDKDSNFHSAETLIKQCKTLGAQMVFMPEACDYIAESQKQSMAFAEPINGTTISKYKQLARNLSVWISIGGFHQKGLDSVSQKLYNTHVILDSEGEVRGVYCKSHMFDLDIPGKIRLCESDYTITGDRICPPVDTPAGRVGMGICYDMRFPEMSVGLRHMGADILTFPSAFTVPTGMAHWHVLLRNRAIENQCYVVAAAQTGKHNEKRSSYGHSLIVDPWGVVIAECSEGEGVCVAEVDLQLLTRVRTQMPILNHRRPDLYGSVMLKGSAPSIDSIPEYEFGQYKIGSRQVFHRTALSYAFVNIKPVVPAEVSDLFNTTKVVSKHVHVHILPRKAGDFAQNDQVYDQLQKHDQNLEEERRAGRLRSEHQMNEEAAQLRKYFI